MLDTTVQTATTQPAQVAQIAVETKKSGASNTSEANFAKSLASKLVAPGFAQAVEVVKQEAKAPAETQEAQKPTAEVKETETKTEGGETPAEPAEATETETDEVLSPETHALDPKLQAKIDRRIGKEVAKRKALEQEVASLKALVTATPQEIEKEVHVPVPSNVPLAEITSMDALNQYREALSNDIIEAEGLLYSDFPPEGKQTKWGVMTKETLVAALTQAKKDERTAIPAREKFLTARTQATQTANDKFPFLKDPTHPGYQMAKQALRENPVLRSYPNSDYLVGMIVKGQLAMQAEDSGKTEVKTPAKPKAVPTKGQSEITSDASITRAPVGSVNQNALSQERSKVLGGKKSLDAKGFAELLKANQRYRNSQ